MIHYLNFATLLLLALTGILAITFKRGAMVSLSDPVEKLILEVVDLLNTNANSGEGHYSLPWTLVLGIEGSKKKYFANSNASMYLAQEESQVLCSAQIHAKGVVLKVPGRFSKDSRPWKSLIRTLAKYRSKSPLNSLVVMWPCGALDKISEVNLVGDQISDLQNRLGLKLPLYLLVSECQEVKGFSQLVKAVPESEKQKPIGLSCASVTSGLDLSKDNSLLDMARRLCDLALVSSGGVELELLLLVPALEQLGKRISYFLENLLRPRHEGVMPLVRGLYFCSLQDKTLLFCDDLLKKKIFLEAGLVRLLQSRRLSRNTTRVLNVCAIVLPLFGILYSILSIPRIKKASLIAAHEAEALQEKASPTPYSITNLLTHLARFQAVPLHFPPISWDPWLRAKKQRLQFEVFKNVLLSGGGGVRRRLKRAGETSLVTEVQRFSKLSQAPSFVRIKTFLEEVIKVEEGIEKGRVQEILPHLKVPESLVCPSLPDRFSLTCAIANRTMVQELWHQVSEGFIKGALQVEAVASVMEVVDNLRLLEDKQGYRKEDAEKLARSISGLMEEASGELMWLCGEGQQEELYELISKLNSSDLLGSKFAESFFDRYKKALQEMRCELLQEGWPAIEFLFSQSRDSDGVEPSQELKKLLGYLNLLLSQDFMQHEVRQGDIKGLVWDTRHLARIADELELYQAFRAQLLQLPSPINRALESAATNKMVKNVKSSLAQARLQLSGQDRLVGIANNIRENELLIGQIVRGMRAVDGAEGNEVVEVIIGEAEKFLLEVHHLLDGLYNPGFLVECALAGKQEDLYQALSKARLRLFYLVKQVVEPVILLIDRIRLHEHQGSWTSHFWRSLAQEVKHYAEGKGEIAEMEGMLADLMQNKLRVPSSRNPYLQNQIKEIASCARGYVGLQIKADLLKLYTPLASYFTDHLAGRFPFGDKGDAKEGRVLEFFRMYDKQKRSLERLLSHESMPPELEEVRNFVRQMEECKAWLGLTEMEARVKLLPPIQKEIYSSFLVCDTRRYPLGWREVAVPWNRYRSFALETTLANMGLLRFRGGGKKITLRMRRRWSWIKFLTPHVRNGVVYLSLPTTKGRGLPMRILLEFYGKEGRLGWPLFPVTAPSLN